MKKAIKTIIIIALILTVAWAIIHRRVIKAWLTGSEMPKAPDWHPKFCSKKEREYQDIPMPEEG